MRRAEPSMMRWIRGFCREVQKRKIVDVRMKKVHHGRADSLSCGISPVGQRDRKRAFQVMAKDVEICKCIGELIDASCWNDDSS